MGFVIKVFGGEGLSAVQTPKFVSKVSVWGGFDYSPHISDAVRFPEPYAAIAAGRRRNEQFALIGAVDFEVVGEETGQAYYNSKQSQYIRTDATKSTALFVGGSADGRRQAFGANVPELYEVAVFKSGILKTPMFVSCPLADPDAVEMDLYKRVTFNDGPMAGQILFAYIKTTRARTEIRTGDIISIPAGRFKGRYKVWATKPKAVTAGGREPGSATARREVEGGYIDVRVDPASFKWDRNDEVWVPAMQCTPVTVLSAIAVNAVVYWPQAGA